MEPHKTVVVDVVNPHRRRAFSKAAARADKTENELFLELLEKRVEKAESTFDFRFQVPAELYDRARVIADAESISIDQVFQEIVAPKPLKFRPAQGKGSKPTNKTRMVVSNVVVESELIEGVRQEARRRRMAIKDFVRIALENKLTRIENEGA